MGAGAAGAFSTIPKKQEPQARKGTHTLGARYEAAVFCRDVGRRCSATLNNKQSTTAKAFPLHFINVVYLFLGRARRGLY